eukprot:CAMPEP_0118945100 /NCGR_PEP_ID=MMETSP1169-20130426/41608_1 /TAXON_ID=36882 /ORGANISM="Pyramimonas obovata, Strain CCMP722" /LENGTH=565 /DNA_ID=CAMNT_0006890741 /DNA_START=46 /DNA_END=1743 /DNA_ORIENTATION=+
MSVKGLGALALSERVGAVACERRSTTRVQVARRTTAKRVSLKCTKHSEFAQGSRGIRGTHGRIVAVTRPAPSVRQPMICTAASVPFFKEGQTKNLGKIIGAVAGVVALTMIVVYTKQISLAAKALVPLVSGFLENHTVYCTWQYTMWVTGFLVNFALGWFWATKKKTKEVIGNSLRDEKRKTRGLKIDLNGQSQNIASLNARLQVLQAGIDKEKTQYQAASVRVKELETTNKELLERVAEGMTTKQKLEKEVEALSSRNETTKRQLEEVRAESIILQEKYAALKKDFREFAQVNQAQVVVIAKQTGKLKDLKAALETAQSRERIMTQQLTELETESSILIARKSSLEGELEQAARALAALKAEAAGTAAEAAAMRAKHAAAVEKLVEYAEAKSALELAEHRLGLLYGDMCSHSDEALESFDRKELIEIKAYAKFKERGYTHSKEEEILDYHTSEAEVEALEKEGATEAELLVIFCKVAAQLLGDGDDGFLSAEARQLVGHTLGAISFVKPAAAKANGVVETSASEVEAKEIKNNAVALPPVMPRGDAPDAPLDGTGALKTTDSGL